MGYFFHPKLNLIQTTHQYIQALLINNYSLDPEKLMIFYWEMFKALQHINNDESDRYKNIAIKNMDKYLEIFKQIKDKYNVKSNHKTIQEILHYQNTVIN